MYSYRFSPNMQIYLLRFCAAESMIPIFRPFSSTRQLSKSCTSLASFLLSIKSMQIWSVNLVRPWCNLLPLISSIFRFFKFAEWAEVCRTRKSSRKRITRTSLGLRCFDTVFQRPYRYFSIASKVFFPCPIAVKFPIITIIIIINIIIIIIIKVQTTDVSCWAVKRRVKNRILC